MWIVGKKLGLLEKISDEELKNQFLELEKRTERESRRRNSMEVKELRMLPNEDTELQHSRTKREQRGNK